MNRGQRDGGKRAEQQGIGRNLQAELDHFLDCVIDGAAPLTGGEEGRRALELADAALESVKTGKPVKV